jgi:hypothetical protein
MMKKRGFLFKIYAKKHNFLRAVFELLSNKRNIELKIFNIAM